MLWSSCQDFEPRESVCFSRDYLSSACPLFPLRLIKTVRLRVREAAHLLASLSHLQVVVLLRDPRAVFNSRWEESVATWCSDQHCSDPTVSCHDLEDDIIQAVRLRDQYEGRVLLLRSRVGRIKGIIIISIGISGTKISASIL